MQYALLPDELTTILGSGRFKSLPKRLRTHLPSLRDAARQYHRLSPASALDKDKHQQCRSVEDDKSLQREELVAEIEERVTQLENVLTVLGAYFWLSTTYRVYSWLFPI